MYANEEKSSIANGSWPKCSAVKGDNAIHTGVKLQRFKENKQFTMYVRLLHSNALCLLYPAELH